MTYALRVVGLVWLFLPLAVLVSPNAMATPSSMLALASLVLLVVGAVALRRIGLDNL